MDVLNAVESVQSTLHGLLMEKNGTKETRPSPERQALEVRVMSLYLLHYLYSYLPIQQNPFLCLFVDIYNVSSQDENLKSERFVTSVILNGKGEELAPKTPSELIALAQKVESRPVNLGMLEEYLPEVPIEDQVMVGLGWDSQQQKAHAKKRDWETALMVTNGAGAESRHGDENDPHPITLTTLPVQDGVKENGQNEGASSVSTSPVATAQVAEKEQEEEELEEWEIEAERRFQDSDIDDAPSLPSPASKKSPSKTIKSALPSAVAEVVVGAMEPTVKKISPALEQAAAVADQDPVKRRRKTWQRK
ncbi:hypothetical protein EDD11_007877 [Mortierella claussenii]|nr:hypothetical protein EDD11_007877 [Mortierella claussenii]